MTGADGPRRRAAVFDFYGTLARATRWGPRIEDLLARWGLAVDPAAAEAWRREVADGSDHRRHSTDRDTYVAWERARFRRLAVACGAADAEEVASALHSATKDYDLAAYPEVPSVLEALGRRGVAVAVCSNWDWDLDRALERAGLTGLVDVAVTSARAGVRKPHPRIFEVTLDALGVDPGDAVFAGDTWGPDVEGPLAAGMTALHVWRDDAPPGDPPPLPPGAHRAGDLGQILDLVGPPVRGLRRAGS